MALAADRNTPRRSGDKWSRPVKGGVKIYAGALVCLDANGFAVPGAANAAYKADGRAEAQVDNTAGADGAVNVGSWPGIFRWANSAGVDAITAADIGHACYVVDDLTVAKTSNGGARVVAGTIVDVDAGGVWVEMAEAPAQARSVRLPFSFNQTDLLASTSQELISPVNGVVSKLSTTVQVAITTGGNIGVSVGATPVVGIATAIANAAAKGAINTHQPTVGDATTAVAVDGRIQVTAANFATAGAVSGYVEITY